jgi:hypothetical protein
MRKKILMVGSTDNLPGVPIDISAYYSFFTSPAGGHWYDEEIDILLNPTQRELLETIAEIEEADYDYVIVFFSGHGEETSNGTVLAINGQGETILLHNLTELSQRQLLIVHCCRNHMRIPVDVDIEATALSLSHDAIRQAYNDRILHSAPQQVILFSCDDKESTWGTSEGGYYSQYLLDAIQSLLADSHSPFVNVGRAHYKAVSLMRRECFLYERQHPKILQSRCLPHQRLPLAINPCYF